MKLIAAYMAGIITALALGTAPANSDKYHITCTLGQ